MVGLDLRQLGKILGALAKRSRMERRIRQLLSGQLRAGQTRLMTIM